MLLKKSLESPLDSEEIKLVNPKGNQQQIAIGRTDAEAEAPILCPRDAKNQFFGNDLMLGKIEGRRRKGTQRMRLLDVITNSMNMSLGKLKETVKDREAFSSVQFSSVAQSCPTLCDPMNLNRPGLSVHHQLPEFTQTHVHQVSDAIQPSHPLSSPSPPAPNPSQNQGLFQ